MNRPTHTSRVAVAALATVLLAAVVASFTTSSSASPSTIQYSPQSTSEPVVTGDARQGSTLTTSNGTWNTDSTITYTYQWRRCNSSGDSCADIAGANGQTHTVAAADVGSRLRSIVIARNASGTSSSTSNATAVVTATGPEGQIRLPNGQISIPASSVALPHRLVVSQIQFSQSPIRSRNPLQARFRVQDSRGFVVRDALVYATAIPFGRIVQPAETRTDQEGWATMTIQPTRLLPLRNGFLLTMFVRARKQGDDVLAGVSTRRLISVRTANPS
jgi:hypothetical protein